MEIIDDLVEEAGTPIEELSEEVVTDITKEEPLVGREGQDPNYDGIPEKFKGKSSKDIAESYLNLEKELGKKANEIGELRKLTDQILQQQITGNTHKEAPKEEIADADFFVDPQAAVQKAIENHPKVKQFEQQAELAQRQANLSKFAAKHGDYETILQEPDFQAWVGGSPVRQRLFAQANTQYDFEAADEIFSQYKERKQYMSGAKEQLKDNRDAALKASAVPSGNSSAETSKKVFRRADLIRLKMTDPDRYNSLSDEITKAYSEGRVK